MMLLARFTALVLLAASTAAAAEPAVPLENFPKLDAQRDWPWWRGPQRNGEAQSAAPVKLSLEGNLRWQADVPGRGHSSPIVVGDRVFLTTALEAEKRHLVLAYSRASGERLWSTEVNSGGFPAKNHAKNTEASSTAACDGERVYATFYHHDAVHLSALSLEGRVLWSKSAGAYRPRRYEYGYAPSPLLYRDTVIVAAEYDGDSYLAAFEGESGKEKWRIERPRNITFSSPVVAEVAGREQLLISGARTVAAYDPASGRELWNVSGTSAATCGTLVWENDLVFASGGYPESETLAVRADGGGEVLWRNRQKCYEQSMLVVDGYLYAFTDSSVFYCWRTSDGAEMWKERLEGPISASPVLAGGHIYWANERGKLYVLRANPERFELVAENQIGDDSFASPAILGGQIFLRVGQGGRGGRQEKLYCFGE